MSAAAPLGRTGLLVPRRWVRAHEAGPGAGPVLLDGSLALWGPKLHGSWLAVVLETSATTAPDADSAHRLTEADLVAAFCCLGRPEVGMACLRAPSALEAWQLEGAVRALAEARDSGQAQALGLYGARSAAALLANWRYTDAFDAVLADCKVFDAEVVALAHGRRTTLVSLDGPCDVAAVSVGQGREAR